MPNATLVNFAAGETSPKSRGRFDLPWFQASCEKLLNFVAEAAGPARYRTGFSPVAETCGGGVARIVPFRVDDVTLYMLEFTVGKVRAYKDNRLLVNYRTTITAATKADPCVITVTSTTGLANGDTVYIDSVIGMEDLNGRYFKLAGKSGSTYQLTDAVTGAAIVSTGYGTYASAGYIYEVTEATTPYVTEDDLSRLQWAPDGSTLYLTDGAHPAQKLTIDSAGAMTVAAQVRTSDPFSSASTLTVTRVVRSGDYLDPWGDTTGQTYVEFTAGDEIIDGAVYAFAGVVGTTEINGGSYRLEDVSHGFVPTAVPTARLTNATTDAAIDSAAWTAYVSGGTATAAAEVPLTVGLYESRLVFGGTNQRPGVLFLSRAPSDAGAKRLDDFTGGTAADDASFFELAAVGGASNYCSWVRGTENYLFVGTYGGPFRVSGGGVDEPITPSNVNARQFDVFGCEATLPAGGTNIYFIQRGGRVLRSVRYDIASDRLRTRDMLLNAEHVAFSRLRRVVLQVGRPDALWVVRDDGVLYGMTVQDDENVAGWHRHTLGGTAAKVLDVAVLPRTDRDDQLWIVSERTINGTTRRFVEVQADPVDFPDRADFFTGEGSSAKATDLAAWKNAVYRRQEEYIHLDAAGTYNGSDRGADAEATLTPGATAVTVGSTGVAFTASASVFNAGDVGNELWKKPDRETGVGSGRATITAYVSPTQVTCTITVAFNAVTVIAAGAWYIAADTIYVSHLNGERVAVVTDGAVYSDGATSDYPTVTVSGGKITLPTCAAVVHVGLPYTGIVKTHNLELSEGGGPAQNKPRNIVKMFLRFLWTLGVNFGTDVYDTEAIEWRDIGNDAMDRPAPVFSGSREVSNPDTYEASAGKRIVVKQALPLPCIVEAIDIEYDVGDE